MSHKNFSCSYKTAVNWLNNKCILANNICEIDPSVYDNARFDIYDDETDEFMEVYSWFLTDCSTDDVEFLEQHFSGLHFTYSDLLGMYVLCVTHFGTPWDGVMVETDLENAAE